MGRVLEALVVVLHVARVAGVAVVAQPATAPGQMAGLIAADPAIVSDVIPGGEVEFTLANSRDQPAVAWAVDLTCRYPDGTARPISVSIDGYLEHEGLVPSRARVVPAGGSVRTRVQCPGINRQVAQAASDVAVRCAVWLDTTALGSADCVSEIFQAREACHEGWLSVVEALRSAQADLPAPERLEAARQALNRAINAWQRRPDTLPRSMSLRIVEITRDNLARAQQRQRPPDEVLADLASEADAELAAVMRHRRP